jgi:hypothetical protein
MTFQIPTVARHPTDSHRARHIFQACPVWIYTQSNITNIIFTWAHVTPTPTAKKSWHFKVENISLLWCATNLKGFKQQRDFRHVAWNFNCELANTLLNSSNVATVICWCMVVEVFKWEVRTTVENRTCTPIIYHTIYRILSMVHLLNCLTFMSKEQEWESEYI